MPVDDIDAASRFYERVLGFPGKRVTSGRHYFDCDGVLLACWDPLADGDADYPGPNPGTVYLAAGESLDAVRNRAIDAGATLDKQRGAIARRPWGERSFYGRDPWGNPFCVTEAGTEYRGGGFVSPT